MRFSHLEESGLELMEQLKTQIEADSCKLTAHTVRRSGLAAIRSQFAACAGINDAKEQSG